MNDTNKINIEASDKEAAFYALYAGLRMFWALKSKQTNENEMSIGGAEAYCMLKDLEVRYPKLYKEATEEYETVYPNAIKLP